MAKVLVLLVFGLCVVGETQLSPVWCAAQEAAGGNAFATETIDLVEQLADSSYRARELARWRLQSRPLESIEAFRETINDQSLDVALQMVAILSQFAMHNNIEINLAAKEVLEEIADDVTRVGQQANYTLRAIADLQELKAVEILRQYGATIGSADFSINGQRLVFLSKPRQTALKIDREFTGDDSVIAWIQYLKSIQVVFLDGEQIDSRYFRAIAKLTQLRAIRIDHARMSEEDLEGLAGLNALEHLGLNYVESVDDSYVKTLERVPIIQSLRIFGTRITASGESRLRQRLEGVDIFRGNGGFLGISQSGNIAAVETVERNSAAAAAGLLPNDRLLTIQDVEVKTFDDVRKQLAKFRAGDEVRIQLTRVVDQEPTTLEVTAILGEQVQ